MGNGKTLAKEINVIVDRNTLRMLNKLFARFPFWTLCTECGEKCLTPLCDSPSLSLSFFFPSLTNSTDEVALPLSLWFIWLSHFDFTLKRKNSFSFYGHIYLTFIHSVWIFKMNNTYTKIHKIRIDFGISSVQMLCINR